MDEHASAGLRQPRFFGSAENIGGMQTPGHTPAQRVIHTSDAFFRQFITLFLTFSVALVVYTVVWEQESLYAGVVCLLSCALAKVMLHRGKASWVRWMFMLPLLAMLLVAPWLVNGIRTPLMMHGMLVLIFASWMLGTRVMWACAGVLMGQVVALWYAEKHGLWVIPEALRSPDMWLIALLFSMVVTAAMMSELIRNYRVDMARESLWQEQLSSSLQFNKLIIDSSPVPIRVFDAKGQCIAANHAYAHLMGVPHAQLLAQNLHEPLMQEAGLTQECLQVLRTGTMTEREVQVTTPDGRALWLHTHLVPFERAGQRHLLAHFIDITSRHQATQELKQLAFHDALTGLPNRRWFDELLRQGIQQCARQQAWGVLLMVDLNHFKQLNDTQGHEAGDQLLQAVAQRLRQSTRTTDVVARLGGDEFTVLIHQVGQTEAQAQQHAQLVSGKLHTALSKPYHLKSGVHHGSASIGYALIAPSGEQDAAALLHTADAHMYAHKCAQRQMGAASQAV